MERLNSKLFTILLSIFYILGISFSFLNFSIIGSIAVFVVLSGGILFFNFDYKKSIILFLILILGLIRVELLEKPDFTLNQFDNKEAILQGTIASTKDINKEKSRVRFYLDIDNAVILNKTYKPHAKVIAYVSYDKVIDKDITIGDFIELKGKLKSPKGATNPYQFDYKKYLLNNDCENIFYAKLSDYKVIKSPKPAFNKYFILQKFELLRNKIINQHAKYVQSPNLEILGGIVFGNETINPDEKIKESFRSSGLLHLLAASGLNVALIFGIWWWIAGIIRFPYVLSISIGAIFIIFYCFMTGFPPSILRAGIMLLFVLFGKLIDRNANSASLIFFVAFLILLFNPKMIFDIGFQLSFVVTFGLITVMPVMVDKFKDIEKSYREKHKAKPEFIKQLLYLFSPVNLVSIAAVPLVAQLFVIPLQMHYFNNIAPYSILANIAIVPFIAILSFLGFIGSIFALIPFVSDFMVRIFDFIANPLLTLLIKISEIFSSFKYSLINTISLNPFQMFNFWAIILFLTFGLENNFKNKKQNVLTIFLTVIFLLSFIRIHPNHLEISMFDIGNADCFLITTPKKKNILIDTGKSSPRAMSSYETVIKKFLLNERVKTIDVLILTHFDSDHAGSTLEILKNHKVNSVIIQNEKPDSDLGRAIITYLKENNINYKIAQNQDTIYFEPDLKITTLVPDTKFNKNENSIAELLIYKNRKVLFLADIGTLGYGKIEKYIPKNIDILKIGHHGAKNSLSKPMLDYLNPKYALISAGSNNFNHPSSTVLQELDNKSVKVVISKVQGYSKFTVDKFGEIKLFSFNQPEL